jgi:hypothetical protein
MVANAGMLTKPDVVAYVGANAYRYGLDPAAVLAVSESEGLKSQPGSMWSDPPGIAFGPPSWNSAGAGQAIVQSQGSLNAAAYWSWTPAGLDYWMQKVQESGASGLTGIQAITQIVGGYGWGFERPKDPSIDINSAKSLYDKYVQQLQSTIPGYVPPAITDTPPDQTQPGQLPIPINPTIPSQPQTTTGTKFSLHLFDLPSGPVNLTLPWDFSGILMFLAAIFAIIIGAILWKPSRDAATNVAIMAA